MRSYRALLEPRESNSNLTPLKSTSGLYLFIFFYKIIHAVHIKEKHLKILIKACIRRRIM